MRYLCSPAVAYARLGQSIDLPLVPPDENAMLGVSNAGRSHLPIPLLYRFDTFG
jgi:hypothetical protein